MPEYTSQEYTSTSNQIGIRLKLEMKKRGFTSTELARRADVLTSFLYDIISGKSCNPSTVKLARVADALGVSLTYLVRGIEKTPEAVAHISMQAAIKDRYIAIPHIMPGNTTAGSVNIAANKKEEVDPYYFHSDWIRNRLNADVADLRMLTLNGDNMEPALFHQDIVLIDTGRKIPSPPGIFIVFDGLGLTAKRLEYLTEQSGSHVRVISDNQHYSTYECSISDITIVGRVVWFSRAI